MRRPVITLTTDFGLSDHFVGTMKGVILGICPEARIVDISHEVGAFAITEGAFLLAQAYRYFPRGTVHVVVVDPGVGTARRPILAEAADQYFVAPDNGVLSLIYDHEAVVSVRHITAEHYFLNPVSNTFHGRDVFAPVAAWVAKAYQTEAMGEEISDYVRFTLPKPKVAGSTRKGLVLRVDAFGNLVTNFTAEDLPQGAGADSKIKLQVGGKSVEKLTQTFAQGAAGEPVAIVGSSGFLEIAVNKGQAARVLGVNRGAEVILEIG